MNAFPLSFGADIISVPFVVLMSWNTKVNLFGSADFSRGTSVLFCSLGCSQCCHAVVACTAGGLVRDGSLFLPQSWCEVGPANFFQLLTYFCHQGSLRDDKLQMSLQHCVISVILSQSPSLEQDTGSVSSKHYIRYFCCQNDFGTMWRAEHSMHPSGSNSSMQMPLKSPGV